MDRLAEIRKRQSEGIWPDDDFYDEDVKHLLSIIDEQAAELRRHEEIAARIVEAGGLPQHSSWDYGHSPLRDLWAIYGKPESSRAIDRREARKNDGKTAISYELWPIEPVAADHAWLIYLKAYEEFSERVLMGMRVDPDEDDEEEDDVDTPIYTPVKE
jgi:hypothetical protein